MNFYTLMLMFLGVIAVVFVIMVISLTIVNYSILKYQLREERKEEKKKQEMGIEYFFQDEDEDDKPLPPPKDEEFKPMPDDLFDAVIEDKKEKQKAMRRAGWEERHSKYVIVNEEISQNSRTDIPDEEFAPVSDDLFRRIENSKKKK